MKKVFILIFLMILAVENKVYAAEFNIFLGDEQYVVKEATVSLNGKILDSEYPPYIKDDRTFVPIRVISDYFNSQVDWNDAEKSVTIRNDKDTIKLFIDKNLVIKNGENIIVSNDSIPRLVNYYGVEGKTAVPLRFLSETMGYLVSWDQSTRTVLVKEKEIENQNKIEKIEIVNGSSKNEQIKITANTDLNYKSEYDEDKNSVMLKIENAIFDINGKNQGSKKFDSKLLDNVNYTTFDDGSSAMEIQLKRNVFHQVKQSRDKKSLIVSFSNKVTEINEIIYDGKEAILVGGTKSSEYNVMKLKNPFRYVIDIKDATFYSKNKFDKLDISMNFVDSVRASQFVPDKNYSENDNIVRIVLDAKDGIDDGEVKIEKSGDDLIIVPTYKLQSILTGSTEENSDNKITELPINSITEIVKKRPRPIPHSRADVKIIIDPGHGGNDPGGNLENGFKEKNLTLDVALRTRDLLQKNGYTVIMTREKDKTLNLYDRPKIANDEMAHVFVSVHGNYSLNEEANGIEVLYANRDSVNIKLDEQYPLAKILLEELLRETGMENRGVRSRPDLVVLNQTEMCAALVELGFMTNEKDYSKIITEEFKDECATAIYNGISKFVSEKYGY